VFVVYQQHFFADLGVGETDPARKRVCRVGDTAHAVPRGEFCVGQRK